MQMLAGTIRIARRLGQFPRRLGEFRADLANSTPTWRIPHRPGEFHVDFGNSTPTWPISRRLGQFRSTVLINGQQCEIAWGSTDRRFARAQEANKRYNL